MKNNNVKELIGLVIWRLNAIRECVPEMIRDSLADTVRILKHIKNLLEQR